MKKKGSVKWVTLLLSLVMTAALCFSLAGCGSDSAQQDNPSEESTAQSSENNDSSQSTDPNAVVATASIVSTGDILIHSPFLTSYYDESTNTYDFKEIFQYVKPVVQSADYAVANLEISLGGEEPYSGYPCFNCPDAILDALMDAGFDMTLTANNHMGDTGFEGFERTQTVLTEKGLDWIGSVKNSSDNRYKVVDINGIKVGMVNYTYISHEDGTTYLNGVPISDEFAARINCFDYNELDTFYTTLEQIMSDMKADGAEAAVMYIHWGEEYHLEPMAYQKEIAQKLCDIGFDAIVGGHPHVIEPVEVITSETTGKQTVCLYSMGNEISNQRFELLQEDISTPHTEDGLLFYTNFSRMGDDTVQLTSVDVVPTWVNMYYNENDRRTYEIVPLKSDSDWSGLNLESADNGKQDGQDSYDRTMALCENGVKAFNTLGGVTTTFTQNGSPSFNESNSSQEASAPAESNSEENSLGGTASVVTIHNAA